MINLTPDTSSKELGFIRILFFGILYLTTTNSYINDFNFLPDDLTCNFTLGAWYFLKIPPIYGSHLILIYKISLITSMIGLFSRFSFGLAFLSFFLLNFSLAKYCVFGHIYYPLQIALFLWFLMDNYSGIRLDEYLLKKKHISTPLPLILFLRIHFCTVFFLSGLSKIKKTGLDWALSDNLLNAVLMQRFYFADSPAALSFHTLNGLATEYPFFIRILAIFTLFFELFSPLMLFNKRIANIFVKGLLSMQIGILLIVYINFSSWLPLYVCWLKFSKQNNDSLG